MDFNCFQTNTSTNLTHVANVDWDIHLDFVFNVTTNMTAYLDVSTLKLDVVQCVASPNSCSLTKWHLLEPAANALLKGKLNGPFSDGPTPIGGFLQEKGLGILDQP